jgi:uncharacterized delta-60 repeat protein
MKNCICLNIVTLFIICFSTAAWAQSGALDATFGDGGYVVTSVNFNTAGSWATDVAVQPDDKIVVAAESYNYENTSTRDFYVLRYDANGALDPTFGNGGVARFGITAAADYETPYALAIQPDGKILVGGVAAGNPAVARLNSNGTLDTSFASGGKLTFQFANKEGGDVGSIIVLADDRIMLGGTSSGRFGFARLKADGSFDTTFNGSGKLSANVSPQKASQNGGMSDLTIQPDGKILASGFSGSGPRQPRSWMLMRLNANGSLDTAFGSGGQTMINFGGTWSVARHASVLPDGKILAGGDMLVSPNSTWIYVRYLSNGQIDTTFGSGGKIMIAAGGSSRIEGMAIQPDGKIVGSGWWRDTADSVPWDVMIMRLNPDGSMDNGFGTNGSTFTDYNGMADEGHSMAVQSDGKFVLAGIINGYGATTSSIGLYRYLP